MNIPENIIKIMQECIGQKLKRKVYTEHPQRYIIEDFMFKYGVSLSLMSYLIKNNYKTIPLCYCGHPIKNFHDGSKEYCSIKCQANSTKVLNKTEQTNLTRYGNKHSFLSNTVKEKIKETNLEKYGYENANSSTKIKEKRKQTNQEKYGVDCNLQYIDTILKCKQTNIEKYGTTHALQSSIVKEQHRKSRRTTYYTTFVQQLLCKNIKLLSTYEEYLSLPEFLQFNCLKCGNNFKSERSNAQHIYCISCFKQISSYEIEIYRFLDKINVKYEKSDKAILNGKELDIFIPSHNLAIEFNGLYWHSELYKDKKYHLDKTQLCSKKEIQLIHIFENEWLNQQEIVKSIVKSRLGLYDHRIYARKCVVQELDSKVYREFLECNHIQGTVNSKVKLGLFYENELITVLGIGASRFKRNEVEIHRFCCKLGYQVIGGLSKLIKASEMDNLVSYIDIRYFNGSGYIQAGFKEVSRSEVNYYYVKGNRLYNRIQFQKHKLKDKLNTYDSSLSEHDNMLNNGYYRIYDCGMIRMEYNKCQELHMEN